MNVSKFEPSSCERIRHHLDSHLSNELQIEANHEVLKHLGSCPSCSETWAARQRVKQALRRAVRQEMASPELRDKVRELMSAMSSCAGITSNQPGGPESWVDQHGDSLCYASSCSLQTARRA